MPNSIAAKMELLMSMYAQPVYDSEGNLMGYEETGLVTKEQMLELLMDLDNHEINNSGK